MSCRKIIGHGSENAFILSYSNLLRVTVHLYSFHVMNHLTRIDAARPQVFVFEVRLNKIKEMMT